MKYIVITSKHHDGFALFDSKVSKWDVVEVTIHLKPTSQGWEPVNLRSVKLTLQRN